MLKFSPFRGFRFNPDLVSLERGLCPPYDVVPAAIDRRLRAEPANAIHLELPEGEGPRRYRNAVETWRSWTRRGILARDVEPSFYIVEQSFRAGGRRFCRVGLLGALGLDAGSTRRVLAHEKTLSKPKKDRTRLLSALKVNTSPIFGVYADPSGGVARLLAAARRRPPSSQGTDVQGVGYRLWRVDAPAQVRRIAAAFKSKTLLIADGHHRYEVARGYSKKSRAEGAGAILAYLCAEEDPGLLVLPTHRVLHLDEAARRLMRSVCVAKPAAGLKALERALIKDPSPYAFGLCNGSYQLMRPTREDRGVASRFGTAWLSEKLLSRVDAHDIRYFHDAREAAEDARRRGAAALLVKPFSVGDIRAAVRRAGLLPQKSTYFYPKIGTGLVFRPLD